MARLLLVRHGESEWNANGRWQGHADPPLSELGEQQAKQAAMSLVDIGRVVSSDLQRAHRTAMLIAASLGIDAVSVNPELRERDVGEWSGLTANEIDRAFPGFRQNGRTPPRWETDDALVARVLPAFVALGDWTEGATLVVSHGGVIRALEQHLGAELAPIPNLQGRWFEVQGGSLQLGERATLIER